jgi:hypothetical protein
MPAPRLRGHRPDRGAQVRRARVAFDVAKALTFKACAEQYIAAHGAGWRNAKHAAQWSSTLKTYAEPVIGSLPVQNIDTALVMKILGPRERVRTARPDLTARGLCSTFRDWAAERTNYPREGLGAHDREQSRGCLPTRRGI